MRPSPDFLTTVRRNVLDEGERQAFTFVSEERGPGRAYRDEVLSFAELDRRARGIAVRLEARGLRDRAVLLLYPEGLDFLAAFLGCLYARVVAVPAPLPDLDAGRFARTGRIIADADITWILTDRAHRGTLEKWLVEEDLTGRVACLDTTDRDGADPDAWTMPDIGTDTLAFLQYTSGSTSAPKGVMVSHGNLLCNAEQIRRRIEGVHGALGVGWVPHYHDMGLIGQFLQPLYVGRSYAFSSPIAFIKRPVLWLEMITRFRGSITLAPNFGYELVLRRVTDAQLDGLDLSSLRIAKNGAEPVRAATLERMVERFGPVGFRPEAWMPCYGMAETTLLITAAPYRTGPVVHDFDAEELTHDRAVVREGTSTTQVRRLVSSGRPVSLDVRIVDPDTRAVLPERRAGEIWVRGGSVALGYWNSPEETRETFGALTADGSGPFLRTGDLGFFVNGELYVNGRIKDLIIVNGRNIHAHDIEEAAHAAHPAAGIGAAFAVDDGREQVVLVQEIRTRALGGHSAADLAALLKAKVAAAFELPGLSVVLTGRGSVRRTTSGKMQRRLTRRDFLDGKITELASDLEPGVEALRR